MSWGVLGKSFASAVAVIGALALVSCAGPADTAPSPSSRAEGASTPSPTPTPTEEWVTFTTQDGLASWEQPADWTDTLVSVDEMGEATYDITPPSGDVRLHYMHKIWGLGGPGCEMIDPVYPYEVVASTDIPLPHQTYDYPGVVAPRVAYETIAYPDHVRAGLGTTDVLDGLDGTACDLAHMVGTTSRAGILSFSAQYAAADGTWGDQSFPTMDAAKAYTATDEYRLLTRILTSLRPAEAPADSLAGAYVLSETADCGNFDLTGQTLTVTDATATITTPGQTLSGTITNSGGTWAVDVRAAGADKTYVQLSGTVSAGVYSGTGQYGGINPSGETGWVCDIPSFTAIAR